MKDKIVLEDKDFSFVCPMKSEEMTVINGGYFCDKCDKKVHDVSYMSKHEYEALLRTNINVCVSFKSMAAAGLAFSLAACSTAPKAKPVLMGKIAAPKSCTIPQMKVENKETQKPFKVQDDNTTVEIAGMPIYDLNKYKQR